MQSINIKDKNLHEIAKRAFSSYFDFLVYSKKDPKTRLCLLPENVKLLKIQEFAESYGLNECPELKYIKFKSKKLNSAPGSKKVKLLESEDEDEEGADDLLLKKENASENANDKSEDDDDAEEPEIITPKNLKKLTKTKEQILKKELGHAKNKKQTFDSEDENSEVLENETTEIEVKNIKQLNIEKEKQKLAKSDKKDKLSYKERKLERKRLLKLKKKEAKRLEIDGFRNEGGEDDDLMLDQLGEGDQDGQILETEENDIGSFLDSISSAIDSKNQSKSEAQLDAMPDDLEALERLAMSKFG